MELVFKPAMEHQNLFADSVWKIVQKYDSVMADEDIQVAKIDPQFMGGEELCKQYGVRQKDGANCIIVQGMRGKKKTIAACLVPINCKRTDLNGVVKSILTHDVFLWLLWMMFYNRQEWNTEVLQLLAYQKIGLF